ncbi:MAG: amino acid permease [Bacteroidetes bacterium]|nr:amino acid permease [Bacteroidota bacterium]MBS1739229.1 amino acid permease [Bacteroidota bacterium]
MWQQLFRTKDVLQIEEEAATGLSDGHGTHESLKKVLGVRDLTFMGIAAIVGAGIFSTIGTASFNGGPGIVLLFLFVSIACGFSAVCYAEFASMVPVSGSAYTYSYVAFGELIAWIIGWDLLMEYAIGNIAVAISWSDYFTTLLDGLGIHIPSYFTMDYWTAQTGGSNSAIVAWNTAPVIAGIRIICDLPAFFITAIITAVIYVGIKESRRTTNAMVILKLVVIALVIVCGIFYVQPSNWSPFLPNGMSGVLGGTAAVFFSYIGFDAISTTAEECVNPQRDLPKGMFYSLIVCTILYIIIALVLTGMVSYSELNIGDPLAYVFQAHQLHWLAGIVSISAVIATASVLLVFQLGQPRIWMSMSRDGLLPPIFSRIHPRFKTPSFSTILTGLVVGIPALFMNLKEVVDLCSVGTLFAFTLVSGGILRLQNNPNRLQSKFKTPYINGKWIVPILFIAGIIILYQNFHWGDLFPSYSWVVVRAKIPYIAFFILCVIISVLTFLKNYSLIPVLGFISCSYLLCESGTTNWERFLIWLVIGLVIYFLYGVRNSKLNRRAKAIIYEG